MIRFKSCLKKSALVVGGLMLLRSLEKVIFQFDQVQDLGQELMATDQAPLMGIVFLGTVVGLWLVFSLLGGLIYYGYRKLTVK